MNDEAESRDFDPLLDYLKRTRSFDFTAYKRPSLMRRIQKRMQTVGIEALSTTSTTWRSIPTSSRSCSITF